MSNWVHDLLDQRYDVKRKIWKLEQDLNDKREELWSKKHWPSSHIQCFRVVSEWCFS